MHIVVPYHHSAMSMPPYAAIGGKEFWGMEGAKFARLPTVPTKQFIPIFF